MKSSCHLTKQTSSRAELVPLEDYSRECVSDPAERHRVVPDVKIGVGHFKNIN